MRSPSAPAPADLWFVEANSGERLSGLLPESEARATANELSKTLGLVRVVPGAHVTLRFSAGDGHGGAWFLSALEKRGLVEARPYRDAMGGEFSVPADQVAEVMALPDELGADVEVTQVTRAPATGSTGLRSPEGNGHDEPAPAETSPDKLGAKQVFDAGHVFDATNTHTIWKLAQWRSWRCDRCGLAQDHDEPLHASIPDCLCLPGGGATSHLVCATCLAERRAGGPRVPAQIESDDHAALQSFDATIYLAEAGEAPSRSWPAAAGLGTMRLTPLPGTCATGCPKWASCSATAKSAGTASRCAWTPLRHGRGCGRTGPTWPPGWTSPQTA